jgi:hypothetical protein
MSSEGRVPCAQSGSSEPANPGMKRSIGTAAIYQSCRFREVGNCRRKRHAAAFVKTWWALPIKSWTNRRSSSFEGEARGTLLSSRPLNSPA